ncbi:MAG: competence/damage-inducible protein A [Bacteroidales bacterium]|nr:competence/damage-inducible protein A [Bacteroidales bacterium]
MKENDFVKAKIITIGDELLLGQVVNTNASWLGEQLNANGFQLVSVLTIGDGEKDIMDALCSCNDVDIVIITGGLGPTADDITKPILCKFFNTELTLNDDALENINEIFRLRGSQMTERNRLQAFIPKSCSYIPNRFGTAPCMWFEKNDTVYISLPGVPFEMKSIFTTELIERLKNHFKPTPYARRVIMTTGVGESFLADKIQQWEEALPDFMSLAYLPQYGMVRLRLDARHEDEKFMQESLDSEVEKLKDLISEHIFAYDDRPISEVILNILKDRKQTLSTAESCTGGSIAKMITSIPGCSSVYKGSFVSYATEVKENLLNVKVEHSVVSKEVAEQMAVGVRSIMKTDYALATTGIAGPDGGTEENPIGTVWIALATPNCVIAKRYNFGKDRQNNIERSCITAFEMLRQYLLNN